MSIVMALSGGMDSATLLGHLLSQHYKVHCCIFNYGSKHGPWERMAAVDILNYYETRGAPVIAHAMDIRGAVNDFNSNLLQTGGDIPEGHYTQESMRQTVVPSRNLIMASIMAGLAESVGADKIGLGVHSGDHYIYPDCRAEFVKALDTAIFLASDRNVEVTTPLVGYDKASILRLGYSLDPQVPYELTRTCYKEQEVSCGKCGSCTERLEAFEKIGQLDPIAYEDNDPKTKMAEEQE